MARAAHAVVYPMLAFDIIPDFIPMLGGWTIFLSSWLMVRLIPAKGLSEHRARVEAERRARGGRGNR